MCIGISAEEEGVVVWKVKGVNGICQTAYRIPYVPMLPVPVRDIAGTACVHLQASPVVTNILKIRKRVHTDSITSLTMGTLSGVLSAVFWFCCIYTT